MIVPVYGHRDYIDMEMRRYHAEENRRERQRQNESFELMMYTFQLEQSIVRMEQEQRRNPHRRDLNIQIINARKELKQLKDAK